MRVIVKGGIWKNTEDEILKAAVMKYGLNQWARISSLLVRKSPKQCKARWYEWLDPSIKKTEWTREEEEKLLHLAKLMPTQWRTIAPIVGRTPAQCLEHYEKLLDAAQEKDDDFLEMEDPRKLRPGEIDPAPETKPARPDPIDMDEDEKEMLSEARARLANTKGKKAKRKAREKQLEEARRLAALQKRREMKAAGISVGRLRMGKKKKGAIDYNAEIPFEHRPAAGFYDTSGEAHVEKQAQGKFRAKFLSQMEKTYAQTEQKKRKRDEKKAKARAETDLPNVVMQINRLNDPEELHRRKKMALPAPQVSDRELEEIARLGAGVDVGAEEASGPTGRLLASYEQTPMSTVAATPMRTPSRGDVVAREARNLIALQNTTTPLMGGANTTLGDTDFSGATPQAAAATPNVLVAATPSRSGETPAARAQAKGGTLPALPAPRGGVTPAGATPRRDALQINKSTDGFALPAPVRSQQKAAASAVRSKLAALPAPKNEYDIVVPELDDDVDTAGGAMDTREEDQAEVEARLERERQARREAELRLRSAVLRRELPRPRAPPTSVDLGADAAQQLVAEEMARVLQYDAARYPLKGVQRVRQLPPHDRFSEEEMDAARTLVACEVEVAGSGVDGRAFARAQAAAQEAVRPVSLATLKADFATLREHLAAENKRAVKLEKKVGILTRGYLLRQKSLLRDTRSTFLEWKEKEGELLAFQALQRAEEVALPQRLERLKAEVKELRDGEVARQQRYARMLSERDQLLAVLGEA